MSESVKPALRSREIRVFISSTFHDMNAERDELVKRTFPQLRKMCEKRGVTLTDVDLRWGITDEQSAEGQVLPRCLAEISSCRPYFIGLLGERYGWVPMEYPPLLVQQESWLSGLKDHSVTELEILHGVLNDPGMANHAYFYFRDRSYIQSLPPEKQADYLEGPTPDELSLLDPQEVEIRVQARRRKLDALKDRIRSSGFPLAENYPDPESLGKLVLKDLSSLIDRLYPENESLDVLEQQDNEHEAFAASRSRVYIARQADYEALDAHARSEEPPLVVLGESGAGKSALLANWALRHRQAHPQDLLIMHFIGGTPSSTDWSGMLRRIMGRMKRHFNLQGEIPTKADALRSTFANWLNQCSARGRVVLILDALNQLEDREGASDLVWLPPVIPKNVRLVLSTLPGRALDECSKRGWKTMQVELLTLDERRHLVTDLLGLYSKHLNAPQVDGLAAPACSANPLYLRVLLEELRVFGVYQQLDERIGYYLAAGSIEELYERILERYEADYERECPRLVEGAMSLIWAARQGLSEAELLQLLGEGAPLAHAYWSPLYLASEQSLVSRSGLLGFFHDFLRNAVQKRYLASEEKQKLAHLRLADYFHQFEITKRRVDEEPWQLFQAKAWERLSGLLGDPAFFEAAWQANESELRWYWAQMEDKSSFKMAGAYKDILATPGEYPADLALHIGLLLLETHPQEAMPFFRKLTDLFRQKGDYQRLSTAIGSLAIILMERDSNREAMELVKEQESLCRQLGDDQGLGFALLNEGHLMRLTNASRALELYRECEQIHRKNGNLMLLQEALGNQAEAGIDAHLLDKDSAFALLHEQERICRELGDPMGLAKSLGIQGKIHYQQKEGDLALELLEKAEKIYRDLGNNYYLVVALQNRAFILGETGSTFEAFEILGEASMIAEECGFSGLYEDVHNTFMYLRYH